MKIQTEIAVTRRFAECNFAECHCPEFKSAELQHKFPLLLATPIIEMTFGELTFGEIIFGEIKRNNQRTLDLLPRNGVFDGYGLLYMTA